MRLRAVFLTAGLAAQVIASNSWFPGAKAVYNRWHETELERWLSDHDIPYPSPADRKDLEELVRDNWKDVVIEPYSRWDTAKLGAYLRSAGKDAQQGAKDTKDGLLSKVKSSWYETEESAQQAWGNAKEWILDTWTESQLKAFCDKHGIPVPQPRHRDSFLQKARSKYNEIAEKSGETAAYPGNWLYATWSESDLKAWLDTHGFPAPQPSTRDRLIASVRRNSRLAYLKSRKEAASASASAQAAYASLTDIIIDVWSETQLKEFCDKHSIPVPQGTRANELRALVRKHRADFLGDSVGSSASSAFGAATSKIHGQFAKASDGASLAARDAFHQAVGAWSDSRLKAYLDARGVPVPQHSTADQLRALVRKHSHKASTGQSAWTFDDFSIEKLKKYLEHYGDAAAKTAAQKADATRGELVDAARSAYSSASAAGGANFASATSYVASVTAATKKKAFETWSHTEIKAYLDSFGIPVPQGSKPEELKALARKHWTYFKYGTSSPSETIFAKLGESAKAGWNWILRQVKSGSQAAQEKMAEAEASASAKFEGVKEEL